MAELELYGKFERTGSVVLYQAVHNFCRNYLLISPDDLKRLDYEELSFFKLIRMDFDGEDEDAVPFGYIAIASMIFHLDQPNSEKH